MFKWQYLGPEQQDTTIHLASFTPHKITWTFILGLKFKFSTSFTPVFFFYFFFYILYLILYFFFFINKYLFSLLFWTHLFTFIHFIYTNILVILSVLSIRSILICLDELPMLALGTMVTNQS